MSRLFQESFLGTQGNISEQRKYLLSAFCGTNPVSWTLDSFLGQIIKGCFYASEWDIGTCVSLCQRFGSAVYEQ